MFCIDTFSLILVFSLALAPLLVTETELSVAFDIPFAIQLHHELPIKHCPNLNPPFHASVRLED